MAGTFDKDFGYLIPFLDRVAGAAGSLSDPASRKELVELMTGEKARWTRIQQLLQSTSETGAPPPAKPVTTEPAKPAPSVESESRESFTPQFTVGSLRNR